MYNVLILYQPKNKFIQIKFLNIPPYVLIYFNILYIVYVYTIYMFIYMFNILYIVYVVIYF